MARMRASTSYSRGVRTGTYSIVARDPASGDLGVAVQSHWFSVGSVVTWARAGVGAVATQSVARIEYGPEVLDGLAAGGRGPRAVLDERLAADELARLRQVAVVDATGDVAVHTGADCIAAAGHATGEGFSCQANMMARDGVAEAMAEAYVTAAGAALPERLLAALQGAEHAVGDVRGRQSCALLVVPGAGEPWQRRIELRVEDHED